MSGSVKSPAAFAALFLGFGLIGCGSGHSSPAAAENSTSTSDVHASAAPAKRPAPAGKVVMTDYSSDYGRLLVDERGHTLYLFTKEKHGRSECFGDCARAWPPLLTKGAPRAAHGASAGKLGTTKRGSATQVTYNGHPLYFYVGEHAAKQILCQAAVEFGGTWLIVAPSGKPIS